MCRSGWALDHLVDGSSGIMEGTKTGGGNSWDEIMYFLNNVTYRLDDDQANVAFVKYSNRESSMVEFLFTKARDVMSDMKINPSSIRFLGGTTDTAAALRKVRNEVIRGPNNRNYATDVVVLITDGPPSQGDTDPARLAIHANDLRNAGMPRPLKIIIVGVSGNRQTYQNLRIVSNYQNNYNDIVHVDNYRQLRSKVEGVLRDICPGELTYAEKSYPSYSGKSLHGTWSGITTVHHITSQPNSGVLHEEYFVSRLDLCSFLLLSLT